LKYGSAVKFFLADEVRLEKGRALRQFELQLAQSRAHSVPAIFQDLWKAATQNLIQSFKFLVQTDFILFWFFLILDQLVCHLSSVNFSVTIWHKVHYTIS